jgi:hypothetical protein
VLAALTVRAARTRLALGALGTARSWRTCWPRLALKAASHLQRQQDVGGGLEPLDRSDADFAAFGTEGEVLAGLGPFGSRLRLLDLFLVADLGHG